MFWAKRRFSGADAAQYQNKVALLQTVFPNHHDEFVFVCKNTDTPGNADYYVGVPLKDLLVAFDGFENVDEGGLPREIDAVFVADANSNARFSVRST